MLQCGYTAIMKAARNGHEAIVEMLLDSCGNVDLEIKDFVS